MSSSGKGRFARLLDRLTGARRKARKAAARARLERLESRLDYLEGVRAQWERSLPQLLRQGDNVAKLSDDVVKCNDADAKLNMAHAELKATTERVFGQLSASVQQIWLRLDVVREETLLEIRYGAQQEPAREAKILDPAKLARLSEVGLRLNLGCGHIPLDDFLNVDMRDLPGVDVVAQVGDLPFEPDTIHEIHSAHMLEHFPQEELKRRLLPHWFSRIAPGGAFRAIVPDGAAMLKGVSDGSYSFEDFRAVLFGGQEYDGDFHFNMFTPESLAALLRNAGFVDVRCLDSARRNGRCFEFEITAIKPR
jgi:hypothetical protein